MHSSTNAFYGAVAASGIFPVLTATVSVINAGFSASLNVNKLKWKNFDLLQIPKL
jgi:hypothetical protein